MFKTNIIHFFFCLLCFQSNRRKVCISILNLVTSPRQALCGKTVTIYDDDVNQANFNPATINAGWIIICIELRELF
jgi:hypothetical protein